MDRGDEVTRALSENAAEMDKDASILSEEAPFDSYKHKRE